MKAIAVDGGDGVGVSVRCAVCLRRPDASSRAIEGSGMDRGGAMGRSLFDPSSECLPATFRSSSGWCI